MINLAEIYKKSLAGILIFGTAFILVALATFQREGSGLLAFVRGNYSAPPEQDIELDPFQGDFVKPLEKSEVKNLLQQDQEISAIVDRVSPSVVSISIGQIMDANSQGQGSGVIVRDDGHIMTNYHVVAPSRNNAKEMINVELLDGSMHEARVVGVDPMVDLAMLKIETNAPLPALEFGDSERVKVGHKVFAFGNPYRLGVSFSQGNISAEDRSITDMHHNLFQITAALNPGQSGGPLVNVRGELIGINSAIYSSDQRFPGFQGIAFTIPSNTAKQTMAAILRKETPSRGYLGIRTSEVKAADRTRLNFNKTFGSILRYIAPISPAADGGLKQDDIITHFNGKAITNGQHFIRLVERSANKQVDLTMWRDGKEQTIQLTVGDISRAGKALPTSHNGLFVKLGIVPRNLTTEERMKGALGIYVQDVIPGSHAHQKIQKGDFIIGVNGRLPRNTQNFFNLFHEASSNKLTRITVLRPGRGELHLLYKNQ